MVSDTITIFPHPVSQPCPTTLVGGLIDGRPGQMWYIRQNTALRGINAKRKRQNSMSETFSVLSSSLATAEERSAFARAVAELANAAFASNSSLDKLQRQAEAAGVGASQLLK